MEALFHKDILEMIERLKGNFTLIDFGFPGGKYLKKGFWIKVKAEFPISIPECSYKSAKCDINGEDVYITGQGLDDIEYLLGMLIPK